MEFNINAQENNSYEVIVIGGGPSGVTAACASAREGRKTLLIEQTGALGGMGTNGLVPCFCPFTDKEKIIYRSLAQEVLFRTNKTMDHVADETADWTPIQPEALKEIYDDLTVEHGVDVLFFTSVCYVQAENGEVKYILATNKEGFTAYSAKVYVDCSGDGDVAVGAGAEYVKGDGNDGELQPASLCFVISNIDDYAYLNGPDLSTSKKDSPCHQAIKSGKYSMIKDAHVCHSYYAPGCVGFNAGHIFGVDPENVKSTSDAMMYGRKLAKQFLRMFRECSPKAFANAFISLTSPVIGIRESRRITGDYTLTVDDFLSRRTFKNEIARNSYFIDVHPTLRELEEGERSKNNRYEYGEGESHGIPYTCLTPKNVKNVLVAGKTISCEREVQGSVRVMPVCLAMGEAAGIAAAMAVKDGDVHAVDTDELRTKILSYGGYIL